MPKGMFANEKGEPAGMGTMLWGGILGRRNSASTEALHNDDSLSSCAAIRNACERDLDTMDSYSRARETESGAPGLDVYIS